MFERRNTASMERRIDRGSRQIQAGPEALYRAYLDPQALAAWRPPQGMRAEIFEFDARPGGHYRMAFRYDSPSHQSAAKSGDGADIFEGRFQRLEENRRIVEVVEFESDDPDARGEMTITTTLTPCEGGTLVEVECANVPPAISEADHQAGIASSLANLAHYVEGG